MNNRIKELAEQAGAETWSRAPMRAVTGLAFTDENLKKFAELIVQECAEVIFETSVEYIEIDAMHRIRDNVKSHFGVE